MTVDNGYEALKLVEEYNGFKGISPHVILSAFVIALTPAELEARIRNSAFGPANDETASDLAVCTIFEEFCVCAACLVLDKSGACEPCPDF